MSVNVEGLYLWPDFSRGKLEYFESISEAIDGYYLDKRDQQKIDFCRRQIELVNKFHSRLETMKHVLETVDPSADVELTQWALKELFDMQAAEADEIMFEYVLRLIDKIENGGANFMLIWPVYYLQERNWTVDDFTERGAEAIYFYY